MPEYLKDHWVEIAGAVLSLIYLYLSIKEKAGLWILGFISSAFYVVVFFESKLYADMSLQFYYLAVSVYGWFSWKRKVDDSGAHLAISTVDKQKWLPLLVAFLAILAVYYIILQYFTDSPVPKADSVVGALSVIATWMLAKKKIENWLLWILADGLAAGLYFYKELYPTVILYIVYTVMAVVGYSQWKKSLAAKDAACK